MKPYQPEGLWKELAMQDMDYVQSKGPDLYRRSLYIFWKRTIAPPMMVNFDAAQRESCVVRETRTNTPLQALDLMNDVTFVEAARFLGQRMMKEGGARCRTARLRYGFRAGAGPLAVGMPRRRSCATACNYHLRLLRGQARRRRSVPEPGRLAGRSLAGPPRTGGVRLRGEHDSQHG